MRMFRHTLLSALLVSSVGFANGAPPSLSYQSGIEGPAPIPPSEQSLQSVTAEPWFKVSDDGLQLEGPAFDSNGNLYFVEVFGGRIFKLTPDKELTTILGENDLAPAGLAIHQDGRLYIAGLGNFQDTGSVVSIRPDGTDMQTVVGPEQGYLPDDLVFDDQGGFYFTDFRGTSTEKTGGVYYVSPDQSEVTPILPNMAIANGVALGPKGKFLWTTEFSAGRLHRVGMSDATTIAPFGTSVTYQFTGPAPDSIRTDQDGNVYVAMYGQGRILAFNGNGMPIGQILLPGREKGHNLRSTSMAFRPGTNELLIFTNDWDKGEGSQIFRAEGFAEGTALYANQP